MSRVLIVLDGYAPGLAGAEHMAWQTAEHLARRGHRVAVLAASSRPEAETSGVDMVTPSGSDPALPWPPDVVHLFDLARPGLVSLALEVAGRHGARIGLTPASAREVWPDAALGGLACRRADVVFALTGHEAETLREAGAGRIVRIGQGPQLSGRPDPAGLRRRLSMDGPVVLYLGRRDRFKGYHTLLEAAPLVWSRLPDARFLIAGPRAEADEPPAPAPADPRIHDLGLTDARTKHDALAACDVLCLPTTADIFPLVFVEAWACGKPVISGEFAGAREVVRDGIDGLIVASRPDAVAGALVRLLSERELGTAMGEAGRRRVEAELSWDRVAEQVERGYCLAGAG